MIGISLNQHSQKLICSEGLAGFCCTEINWHAAEVKQCRTEMVCLILPGSGGFLVNKLKKFVSFN